jgi:AMMECR1 domain-containing protein
LARRSVEAVLRGSSESPPAASGEYLGARRGVFVTLRRRGSGELLGCVGTLVPVCANLVAETWRNARLAAFRDTRFPSVAAEDLAGLCFHVSVLHSREDVSPPDELDPRRYGVIVSAVDGRCGVLLPGIEGINTGEAQLRLAREKGWIGPDEPVKVERFQVDHFEEPA